MFGNDSKKVAQFEANLLWISHALVVLVGQVAKLFRVELPPPPPYDPSE